MDGGFDFYTVLFVGMMEWGVVFEEKYDLGWCGILGLLVKLELLF